MAKKINRKLKIGLITHNYPVNPKESKDAGKFVYKFAHELSKIADVRVYCPDYGGEKILDNNVPITRFRWWTGPNPKLGNLNLSNPLDILKVVSLIISGSIQVIKFNKQNEIYFNLCFWNFPSGVFGYVAKKVLSVNYSTWALGSDIYVYGKKNLVKNLIIRPVLQNAFICYGNSYDICDHIKHIADVPTAFLPASSPIDITDYKKLEKEKFRFLYLGRLEEVKGPDVLVEAAKILSLTNHNYEIVMIGSGSLQGTLERRVKELNLKENIKILGYVEDQSVVNGYLLKSDCLVIPSRSESFPLVVTEALQTGLPIIGSNVGDMPKFIKDHQLGFVFPKEDINSLADCMQRMLSESKRIRKNKSQTMARLYSEFKLDSIARKFLNNVGK